MEQASPWPHRSDRPQRQEIEGLVCQLSAEFLTITSENIESVIVSGLQKIGTTVHADHVFLIFFIENGTTVEKVFEWSASGVFSRKGRISGVRLSIVQDMHPSLAEEPSAASARFITLRQFPPAVHEREYLRTLGIQTIVSLPLVQNGQVIGSFGIDSCQEDRTWFEEELGLLRVTAELFAGALLRYRAERSLATSDARYRALVNHFPNGMILLYDRETRIHLAGGEDLDLCVHPSKPIEGKTIAEVFHPDREAGFLSRLQEPFTGLTPSFELKFSEEWYQLRLVPIRDYRGEITLAMIMAQRITEQKRIERELRESRRRVEQTAIDIQRALLLSKVPQGLEHLDFGFLSIPSLLVDGDFAEFLCLNDQLIDVVFGDVMGKGIPAALIAAATKETILRNVTRLVGRGNGTIPPVEQIVSALRKDIGHRLDQLSVFVTLIYLRLDLANKTVTIVNAGHPPVLHLRTSTKEITSYPSTGMPLGLMFDHPAEQEEHSFAWGDRLLVFSDGITEVRDSQGVPFGEDRLQNLYRTAVSESAQETADAILEAGRRFAGTPDLHDDFTCLVVDLHGGNRGLNPASSHSAEATVEGSLPVDRV